MKSKQKRQESVSRILGRMIGIRIGKPLDDTDRDVYLCGIEALNEMYEDDARVVCRIADRATTPMLRKRWALVRIKQFVTYVLHDLRASVDQRNVDRLARVLVAA